MQNEITETYNDAMTEAMNELCGLVSAGDPNGQANKLIKVIKSLNVMDNAEIEMRLEELMDKCEINPTEEKEETEESMMVTDDLEDLESIIDDYV
jgi:hypothetical protein